MTVSNFIEYVLNLESLIGNRLPSTVHKIQIYIHAAKSHKKKESAELGKCAEENTVANTKFIIPNKALFDFHK